MVKKFDYSERDVTARARSKRRRESGMGTSVTVNGAVTVSGGGGSTAVSGDGHTHANKDALDKLGVEDGYVTITEMEHAADSDSMQAVTKKTKAGVSDEATKLTDDSKDWKKIEDEINAALATLKDLYLSRKTDDSAAGWIEFLKGLKLGSNGKMIDSDGNAVLESVKMGDFEHLLKGMGLYKNASGHWCVECDEIEVRMKAVFEALEIRKLYHSGGNMDLSPAGSKVTKVESVTDSAGNVTGYKCYMKSDDGTMATTNTWREKDLAICKTWNVKEGTSYGVKNQYYWRVVTSVGDGYVVLGNGAGQMDSGSTVPAVGDDIVARGNTDPASGRCSYIEMVTVDDDGIAPALMMWADVHGFSGTAKGTRTALISPEKVEFATKIFRLIDYDGAAKSLVIDCGDWDTGKTYYYNNRVSHGGELWLLDGIAEGESVTGVEPTEEHSQWTLQVKKGEEGKQGEGAVQVLIFTDKGNVIKNGQGSVKLTAVVTKGGEEVTNIPASAYNWKRTSDDSASDTGWNNRHVGAGKEITVTEEDIWQKAVFEVEVSI
jgi:hypothetical protein